MKILFLAYTGKFGNGGHQHSLNTISRYLSDGYKVQIVTMGWIPCKVLEENPYFLKHINTKGLPSLKAHFNLFKILSDQKPNIIHCFDYPSFYYSVIYDPSQKITVVNRCGGPNPIDPPFIKKLLVFSRENYDWLKNKHPNSHIQLTPNRVEEKDSSYYVSRTEIDKSNDFIFLRTCRLSNSYRKSIFDSITLVRQLNELSEKKSKLVVIGNVQSEELHQELLKAESLSNGMLRIITDAEITKESAKYLDIADAIIGVGRSAAEGAALSRPILAIDRDGTVPILLRDEFTWQSALSTNISERNCFSEEQRCENTKLILKMLVDENYRNHIGSLAYNFFTLVYSTQHILTEYTKFYQFSDSLAKPSLQDIFIRTYRSFKLLVNNALKRV